MASKKAKAVRHAKQGELVKSAAEPIADPTSLLIAKLQHDLDAALARIAALEARPIHYAPPQYRPWWQVWS